MEYSRSLYTSFFILIGWMMVIFSFSAWHGNASVLDPPLWFYLERKGAHIFEYTVLMLLSFRFWSLYFQKDSFKSILFFSALFSFMYAATDELHQYFVPMRGSKFSDVLIDSLGILLATCLILSYQKRKHSLAPNKKPLQ